MKKIQTLSKTKILKGLQCPKQLYLHLQHPELEPPIDASLQMLFNQGRDFGELARGLYPGGTLVDTKPWDFFGTLKKTETLIRSGTPTLFEAGFMQDGIFVRSDILYRESNQNEWNLIEVKSGSTIKEENLYDIAIQYWVLTQLGLKIKKASFLLINKEFMLPEPIESLFVEKEVTSGLDSYISNVESRFVDFFKLANQTEIPDIDIGEHCKSPYACPFLPHCFEEKKIPSPSVFNLYLMPFKQALEYYRKGVTDFNDPQIEITHPVQKKMIDTAQKDELQIDRTAIGEELLKWKWPLNHLDFETINFAIPKWDAVKPFEHVPFQYSLIVQEKNSPQDLKYFEYLHDDSSDPRHALLNSLLKAIPSEGSIVAYNMKFEATCLALLGRTFPKHLDQINSIIDRLVDPLPLFREYVYHSGFNGSFSIKSVAPTLVGDKYDYSKLSVKDGMEAQMSYMKLCQGTEKLSADARLKLRKDMLEYCKLDTLSMVGIVDWLLTQTQQKLS